MFFFVLFFLKDFYFLDLTIHIPKLNLTKRKQKSILYIFNYILIALVIWYFKNVCLWLNLFTKKSNVTKAIYGIYRPKALFRQYELLIVQSSILSCANRPSFEVLSLSAFFALAKQRLLSLITFKEKGSSPATEESFHQIEMDSLSPIHC